MGDADAGVVSVVLVIVDQDAVELLSGLTVRKPVFPIEESGVFAERAATR